jgi:hypothetical protein
LLPGGYGFGTQILERNDRTLFGHGGSMPGFLATLWVSPDDGLGAVTLSNVTAGPAIGEIAADLIDIVASSEPRLPERWKPMAVGLIADAVRSCGHSHGNGYASARRSAGRGWRRSGGIRR